MIRLRFWLLVLLGGSPYVIADDALSCIELSVGDRSQMITNTCGYPVEVLWCHTRDEAGYRRGLCGNRESFYQKQAVLQPGQQKQNQFSLPFASTLYIAACKGGYYATEPVGLEGGYLCK